MKNIIIFGILLLALTSCMEDRENYVRYTGWINIDSLSVPEGAVLGETIDIFVKGGAPNGCWSGLGLNFKKENDSTYYINGTGVYERRDGICTDVYQIVDSVFYLKTTRAGTIKFIAQSANDKQIIDSVFVVQPGK